MKLRREDKEAVCQQWADSELDHLADNSCSSRRNSAQGDGRKTTLVLLLSMLARIDCRYELVTCDTVFFRYEGGFFIITAYENTREILISYRSTGLQFMGHNHGIDVLEKVARMMGGYYYVQIACRIDEDGIEGAIIEQKVLFIREIPNLEDYLRRRLRSLFEMDYIFCNMLAEEASSLPLS